MPAWVRSNDSAVKKREMHEGQILNLLADRGSLTEEQFDDRVYEGLLALQSDKRKASTLVAIAAATGTLAYFRLLSGVSSAGVQISPVGFSHIALLMLGFSLLWAGVCQSKAHALRSWFAWKFQRSDSCGRASLLLKYPQACNITEFIPGLRGYPKFMEPEREPRVNMILLLTLLILALLVGVVGWVWLWIGLAIDVWRSAMPSPIFAGLTIAVSAFFWVGGIVVTYYQRETRTYEHTGLRTLFENIERQRPDRARHFARKMPFPLNAGGHGHRRLAAASAKAEASLKRWRERRRGGGD